MPSSMPRRRPFVERGLLSEAEGDQPGCLAALAEDAVATGFQPLVYCNMKAFLNRDPNPEECATGPSGRTTRSRW